jgi:hypothetical protein
MHKNQYKKLLREAKSIHIKPRMYKMRVSEVTCLQTRASFDKPIALYKIKGLDKNIPISKYHINYLKHVGFPIKMEGIQPNITTEVKKIKT